MNKYNEVEIQTAKNLLKADYEWIVRENYGGLYAYKDKPRKNHDWDQCNDTWWNDAHPDLYLYVCMDAVPIFQNVTCDDKEPTSLERIVHPQVLNDAERRYLSAVIRPFRNKVSLIYKKDDLVTVELQRIVIGIEDSVDINLPLFKSGTMYKSMEAGHGYTLEELGL